MKTYFINRLIIRFKTFYLFNNLYKNFIYIIILYTSGDTKLIIIIINTSINYYYY